MDGPSVNWKFYSMLTDEVKKEHNSHMLNIGSFGLHILHRSLKDGAVASGWQLDRLFSNLHWLFQDSPARREDYTKVTGSSLFALKLYVSIEQLLDVCSAKVVQDHLLHV